MANSDLGAYNKSDIQAIADAIRHKNGSDQLYKVEEMADAIQHITGNYFPIERHNDGCTYYYITLTPNDLHVKLAFTTRQFNAGSYVVPSTSTWLDPKVKVDWGDGTTPDEWCTGKTSTNWNTLTPTHAYSTPGNYIIKITPVFSYRELWAYYDGEYPIRIGTGNSDGVEGTRAVQRDNDYYSITENPAGDILLKAAEVALSISTGGFRQCYNLTNVIINCGHSIRGRLLVNVISSIAFYCCYKLANFEIYNASNYESNECNSFQTTDTFRDCFSLEHLDLTNASFKDNISVSTWDMKILKSLTLPNTTTTISSKTFYHSYCLRDAIIPSSVTAINTNFEHCYNLQYVTVLAETPPTWSGFHSSILPGCIIYVPYGCGDTYKAASGWSTYSSRIYELDEE